MTTIIQRYKKGTIRKKDCARTPAMKECPQVRGTVMRARIVTPRKPNSAKRPVAKVVLVNKKRVTAHIPGIGHTIRRYSKVMISGVGARDLPGVRYSLIRGIMDFHGLLKKKRRRSIYGASQPETIKKIRRKIKIKMLKQSLDEQKQKPVVQSFELPEQPLTEDEKVLLNGQIFKNTKIENSIENKIKNLEKKKFMFLNLFLTSILYTNFNKNFFKYKNNRFFSSIELITLLINSVYSSYFFDFMSIEENLLKHEKEFNFVSFQYVKKHQFVISNFFLNIKHNLDFNYKYFHRFLPTDSEKFDSYHKKKNMLSLNNIDLIYDVFLLNYDSLSKDCLQLKFCDNSKLNNYFTDIKFADEKTKLINNIRILYKYDINPLSADILDIIKCNSKTKLFVNSVYDNNILFSDLMNSAKYKFYLYQFTFSCSVATYTMFKILNSAFDPYFSGIVLDKSDYLYDSVSNVFLNISNNFILDKFTNYFTLFSKHISSILLKNKKNKCYKKLKKLVNIKFNKTSNISSFKNKYKYIKVYTFIILNNSYSFNRYLNFPLIKINSYNFFNYNFFLNYNLFCGVESYIHFIKNLNFEICKNKFYIENLVFKRFFKRSFKKTDDCTTTYSKLYNINKNDLNLLAHSFQKNLIQRNNFIKEYINNFLIKFDNLLACYDSMTSIYTVNKKIKAYHTFFNTIFFKKKIYNIFRMRFKKIIFKKFCQLNDISVSLLTNFNINNFDLNFKNFNSLISHLNIFFSKKFNFLKFYFFLKKLIKYLKISFKYSFTKSSYLMNKSIYLFNDFRFINNYSSIDLKIQKLTNLLEEIGDSKKKTRLNLLKKVQDELTKAEEAKAEEAKAAQAKAEEAKAAQAKAVQAEAAQAETVETKPEQVNIEQVKTEQLKSNNDEISINKIDNIKKLPEKTFKEKVIDRTNELALNYDEVEDYENFNNYDFLHKDINEEQLFREFLIKDKKLIVDLTSDENLNINNTFFTTSSELLNYKIAGISDYFEPYNLKYKFEYNKSYFNTLGETTNIFDFVDTSILTKYSNKIIFNKLENYFLTITFRELESARYFKFTDTFLNIGNCEFSKNALFNNNYFNELLYNNFELNKFNTENNKNNFSDSSDFSSEFLSEDAEKYLNLFPMFNNDSDILKNSYVSTEKPKFVYTRNLFLNKHISVYNNFYDFDKINFKKIFLLSIFNRKIKNKIYGTYFFKFNKISIKKNSNYKFFSILIKNFNFKQLVFKSKNCNIKKYKKNKNIKLLSEFSWLFFIKK